MWHFSLFGLILLLLLFNIYNCEEKRPNIIYILVDDVGFADTSFSYKLFNKDNTEPPIITPNIDNLANDGIILKQHYAQEVCAPTRCALLTSKFAFRVGSPFPARDGQGGLPPKIPTFIHELKKRGYKTHLIGKYGVDNHGRIWNDSNQEWEPKATYNDELGPLARGFDSFYGLYFSAHNHFSKKAAGMCDWHKFNSTHLLDSPSQLDTEPTVSSTDIFTRETIKLLKEYNNNNNNNNNNNPYFIYLSYTMPHDPLMVEEKYYSKIKYPYCYNKINHRRKLFCGMMANVDDGIGNITNYLKNNNLLDNTIIIFSSDNGGAPLVGGFNHPFRGGKSSVFEGGVRTPAFIYSSKYFPLTSGKIYPYMFHIVDWGPTILSLIDNTLDDNNNNNNNNNNKFTHNMGQIDGMDLSLSLKNFNNNNNIRNEAVLIHDNWRNSSAIIVGDYKLILGQSGPDSIFNEPNTPIFSMTWDDGDFIWFLTDIVDNLITYIFGVDYFLFEWANMLLAARVHDFIYGGYTDIINKHMNGRPKSLNDTRSMHLPYLNWNNPSESKKIQLYNIKNDLIEKYNIASQNKDIVNKIYNRLNNFYLNNSNNDYIYPQDGAKYYYIQYLMLAVFACYIAVIIIIIATIFYCCRKIFKPKTNNKTKRKKE